MSASAKNRSLFIVLSILLIGLALLHLFVGQINISWSNYMDSLFNFDEQNMNHIIAREIRIPRMVMAMTAGAALSIAGLLMQTLFNNPLAGPYVLGINSGASLFVAFSFMTGIPLLVSDIGTVASALIGAFLFGLIIMSFSFTIRSHISLLLVGLMLGSFTSALVFILEAISPAEELKAFTMWALGSLQHVELAELPLITGLFLVGTLGSLLIVKPLNALVLGEQNAELLGINIRKVRILIIAVTALLTGLITAYCGPIAFIGLAIPNLVRMVFKTQQHGILLIASILSGALFLLICDIIIQLLESNIVIPLNAFTSLVGAPFVVIIILKRLA